MKTRVKRILCLLLGLILSGRLVHAALPNTPDLINCFMETAFSSEYGDEGRDFIIRWESEIRVGLRGGYTAEDRECVLKLIQGIETHLEHFPKISLVDKASLSNMEIVFAGIKDLPGLLPEYRSGNWGFFNCRYNTKQEIVKAKILIASDVTTQAERNHLIQEEIFGALGLCSDLNGREDSILCQEWTTLGTPGDIDWGMLSLLYNPVIQTGMKPEETGARVQAYLAERGTQALFRHD